MRKSKYKETRRAFGDRHSVIEGDASVSCTHVAPDHQMNDLIPLEPVIEMKIAVAEKVGDIRVIIPDRRHRGFLFVFRQSVSELEVQEEIRVIIVRTGVEQIPASRYRRFLAVGLVLES